MVCCPKAKEKSQNTSAPYLRLTLSALDTAKMFTVGVQDRIIAETAPTSEAVKEIFDDNALPFTVRVVGTAPTSEADGI